MILSLIAGFILGAAAIVFALQNTEIVTLTFLGNQFESSLAVLVIASVVVGIVITMLASIPSALSAGFEIMGLKKQNKKLVQELEERQQEAQTHVIVSTVDEAPEVVDLRS